MEVKQNDATYNRPAGDRVLDAPWIFSDLDLITEQLRSENAWEKNERNGITVFKTDKLTVVVTILKEGAEICENSVDGLFVIQIVKGKIKVQTGGEPFELKTGQILHFHEGVAHSISAVEETTMLLSTYLS